MELPRYEILPKEDLYTIYFLVCSISIIHGALEENASLA